MRKLLFLFAAGLIITSCNGLKKKTADKDTDDTEETTKKKKTSDDDINIDDTKTKKNTDEDDKAPKKHSDDDEGGSWSSSDERKFMDECTGTAAPKVGEARAKEYCTCMMGKAEKHFSSYSEANTGMSTTQLNSWAAECNNQ